MKKFATLILLVFILQHISYSQSCLPEGITFSTQAEIDSFQINYPDCTEIEGTVVVSGVDITNLVGLSVLTSVGEYLEINNNDSLSSLTGLDNLTSVRDLWIHRNELLTNLSGLENVVSITRDLWIYFNDSLASLNGLENVNFIAGGLRINKNNNLISLSGLDNLTTVRKFLEIEHNESLVSLTALNKLTSIGDNLIIWNNAVLANLTGLNNIDAGSIIGLGIAENPNLSNCEVESICNYLSSPIGEILISDNAPGCNDQEEIVKACEGSSVDEIDISNQLSIYPNPFSTSTTIEYELQNSEFVTVTILSNLGKQIMMIREKQSSGKQQITWNANENPSGVYYLTIQAGRQFASGKILLVR